MPVTDTRERILDAAVELIARDGYDGVRLADIAKRAGTSTALIHYHFATRGQLLAEAIAHSLNREEARVQQRMRERRRMSVPERVADQIDFALPLTPEDVREWLLWMELENRATRSPELAHALTTLYARLRTPFAEAVADGIAQGVFAPCEPEEVATMAHALLGGLAVRLVAGDPTLSLPAARCLAGRHIGSAIGYPHEFPFASRDLPERSPAPDIEPSPPRQRARRPSGPGPC